jgi:hypothetical protein
VAREGNHFIRRDLFSKAAVRPWACVALAGWIRLKNDEKALVYLTGRTAVLYVPTRQGYSILLIAVFRCVRPCKHSHRVSSPRMRKGGVQVEEQPLLTRGLLTRVARI